MEAQYPLGRIVISDTLTGKDEVIFPFDSINTNFKKKVLARTAKTSSNTGSDGCKNSAGATPSYNSQERIDNVTGSTAWNQVLVLSDAITADDALLPYPNFYRLGNALDNTKLACIGCQMEIVACGDSESGLNEVHFKKTVTNISGGALALKEIGIASTGQTAPAYLLLSYDKIDYSLPAAATKTFRVEISFPVNYSDNFWRCCVTNWLGYTNYSFLDIDGATTWNIYAGNNLWEAGANEDTYGLLVGSVNTAEDQSLNGTAVAYNLAAKIAKTSLYPYLTQITAVQESGDGFPYFTIARNFKNITANPIIIKEIGFFQKRSSGSNLCMIYRKALAEADWITVPADDTATVTLSMSGNFDEAAEA